MIVKTAWPALIPAIEKAGHTALLVSEEEIMKQHGEHGMLDRTGSQGTAADDFKKFVRR